MNLQQLGEFGLIDRLQRQLATRPGVVRGIGDDAAVLRPLAAPVFTCDGLVENVHFRRDWSTPRQLGRKAIAVNVSDVAAMGGSPVAATVTLCLSERDDVEWVQELYTGIEEASATYNLTLAGGDTVRSPLATMLSVALIGEAPHPLGRDGAHPGDLVIATGTLGDSAAGLALLLAGHAAHSIDEDFVLQRHCDPVARLREMDALRSAGLVQSGLHAPVTAAMDISDGIAGDAAHIARLSGVTIELETASLPVSPACRKVAARLGGRILDWVLSGGEDYELLLCVAPSAVGAVIDAIETTGTAATVVGRCVAQMKEPVRLIHANGQSEPAPRSFTHF